MEQAVAKYLADSKARELGEATLYKLNISFRKQLLAWSKAEGYKLLLELQLDSSKRLRFSGLFGDGNSGGIQSWRLQPTATLRITQTMLRWEEVLGILLLAGAWGELVTPASASSRLAGLEWLSSHSNLGSKSAKEVAAARARASTQLSEKQWTQERHLL